jgi:hypothetical protein
MCADVRQLQVVVPAKNSPTRKSLQPAGGTRSPLCSVLEGEIQLDASL